MFKKILVISILFFILALGTAGYFLFIRKPTTSPTAINNNGLPFGDTPPGVQIPTNIAVNSGSTTGPTQLNVLSNFLHLSSTPVAGAITLSLGTTTVVRYVEAGTGHVYEDNLTTGTTSELSNTTIAGVHDATWLSSGTTVILRSADAEDQKILSISGQLVKQSGSSTPYELVSTALPTNIESISVSPDGKKIFYLTYGGNGEEGITANADGSSPSVVIDSSFAEWLGTWPGSVTVALQTKSASGLPSNLYTISTKTNVMKEVLSGINGLSSIINSDGTLIAYSDDNLVLNIENVIKNNQSSILKTIADKCIWSPTTTTILYCGVPSNILIGNYPDNWYQGLTSFADTLYRVDATTDTATKITDFQSVFGQKIDMTNLSLSENDQYLIFTNKIDGTLWSFKLK